MCPDPYDPNWKPPGKEWLNEQKTDLVSLMSTPIESSPAPPAEKPLERTDFQAIKGDIGKVVRTQRRTWTDWVLDVITPCMIYFMFASVVFFLLDVRYVYNEAGSFYLRWVAFFFIMGVVALNRLVARDGSEESMLYIIFFAFVVAGYTFTSPDLYVREEENSSFLNDPAQFAGFNFLVVGFLWWLVNRLTHECCVDENLTAGDIGILTGTARKFHSAIRPGARKAEKRKKKKESYLETMLDLEPFDPLEGYKPKVKPEPPARGRLSDRLQKRHPGISIFYFSIPVMAIFALGLPVVRQGGPGMVFTGQLYMMLYTVSALMLLMLTSLGGLRAHFRQRKVKIPSGIGVFWAGLGTLMVAIVVVAALQLPMPPLPPMAHIEAHQTDFWTRNSTFQLADPEAAADPRALLKQSRVLRYAGYAALASLACFAGYGLLKGLGGVAAYLGARRARYPRFLRALFNGLDVFLARLTRLPQFPKRARRVRVRRHVATSARFKNSLGAAPAGQPMTMAQHVEYAYAALCALAYDIGAPREPGQTPNEFLESFPKQLKALRPHAETLTRLHQVAAYSPLPMDERVQDQIRKFWIAYNRVRNHIVR